MNQCPSCKALHPLNTLYCDECGECLLGDGRNADGVAGSFSGSPTSSGAESNGRNVAEERTAPCDKSAVSLVIGGAHHLVSVPLGAEILLGRLDQDKRNYPDVDLSEYDGLEAGVSRRHARIYCERGDIVVEDLGSVNGSFLNGEQLAPYLAYTLGNGDELQLGKLRIAIVI